MAYTNPSVADFKAKFFRDFPYGTDMRKNVLDDDIANGFLEANATINPSIWPTQAEYTIAYLLISAHFLTMAVRRGSQGVSSTGEFLESGKGVGPASQSFSIPQKYLDNPRLASFCSTGYGKQYCDMVYPKLTGVVLTVRGRSTP